MSLLGAFFGEVSMLAKAEKKKKQKEKNQHLMF